jgi:hypothetical protein
VSVNWITRPGTNPAINVNRQVGWNGLPPNFMALCLPWTRICNAHAITEQAAIGVMALLIHDLEGGELQEVLPIGSGGDYLVRMRAAQNPIQAEISGVREDLSGAHSTQRLSQKSAQVLTQSQHGYVSVTTFSHPPGPIVHSYLHFVLRPSKKRKPTKKRKRK